MDGGGGWGVWWVGVGGGGGVDSVGICRVLGPRI